MSENQAVFNTPRPAFSVNRFGQTLFLAANESMAREINNAQREYENMQGEVPPYLHAFSTHLHNATMDRPQLTDEPDFKVYRFKKTLFIALNEPMADVLHRQLSGEDVEGKDIDNLVDSLAETLEESAPSPKVVPQQKAV